MTTDYVPLERQSLVETITETITKRIKEGIYQPGDKLPSEHTLAGKMNVSRSSIREALSRLTALKVITSNQGQGYFVNDMDAINILFHRDLFHLFFKKQELIHIHEVRKTLEVDIIVYVCERREEEDLERMAVILEKMKEDCIHYNQKDLYGHGMDFHKEMARSSHNPVFYKMIDILTSMAKEAHASLYVPFIEAEEEYGSHEELFKVIKEGDAYRARRLMEEHLYKAEKIIKGSLKKGEGLSHEEGPTSEDSH